MSIIRSNGTNFRLRVSMISRRPATGAAILSLVLSALAAHAASLGSGEAAMTKEDLQLLSSAAGRIKHNFVEPVDESALASGCATAATTAAGTAAAPKFRGAADFTAIPKFLMDLKVSAPAGIGYRQMVYACIDGMVKKLDRHSEFYGPDEYRSLQLGADFRSPAGIGLELKGGGSDPVMVVSAFENTPAWRAGIRGGERILRIDGAPVDGKSLREVVEALRGKTGVPVKLTLQRAGTSKPRDVAVTREIIRLSAARIAWLDSDILHLRIAQFRSGARNNMLREAEKFIADSARIPGALVLDLRDNQGGTLSDAIDVAGVFLADGATVGSTRGRGRESNFVFRANAKQQTTSYGPEVSESLLRALKQVPLAVLVNGRTASGAEMVAAALQSNGRAKLVGLPTLGFGSIQIIYPLGGNAALKLTHAQWYTPKDIRLDGDPLLPDIPIESVPDPDAGDRAAGPDKALQEAVRFLLASRAKP